VPWGLGGPVVLSADVLSADVPGCWRAKVMNE